MRIECEKCNAAFTIGDSLLSDQPIGAQCPYCGHVRVVSRNDAINGARPSAPPGMGGGLPPFEVDATGGQQQNMYAAGPAGGMGMPGMGTDQAWASGGPTLREAPPGQGYASPPGSAPGVDAGAAKCQVCGKPLVDEFDKVIGLCEQHQRERGGQAEFPAAGAPGTAESEWRVRTVAGDVLGPFTYAEIRNRLQREELGVEDQYARDAGEFLSIHSHADLKGLVKKTGSELETVRSVERKPRQRLEAPARPAKKGFSFGLVIGILIILGMGAAGAAAFLEADKAKAIYEEFFSKAKPQVPLPANPLKRVLAKWRLAQPDVSGTPDEHLVTARARHLEDTWHGYQLAQDALKRALLLDEENPVAIANYVENLIAWRDKLLTDEEMKTAIAASKYAQVRRPEDPAVLRALASVELARGDLASARTFAEKAIERDSADGDARLLLALSYLEGNVGLAIQEAEQAQKLVPNLRRTDRLLARAYANAGRYGSAMKLIEQRAKNDPSNSAVHRLFGDIERDLAQLDGARKHYQDAIATEGDVLGARLSLGELQLETADYGGAIETYMRVAKSADAPPAYKVAALGGASRAEIYRNRYKQAADLANQALALAPRDPVALYTRAEVALETNSATTATAMAQKALETRTGEPAILVLLGRTAVQQRHPEEAVKHFEEAIQNDPKDPRLHAMLSAGYLAFGGSSQAFTVMRHAAELDPLERQSRQRKGLYNLSGIPIREAIDRFRKAAEDPRNHSVAFSSIALLHYQSGDFVRAKEALDESLRTDDSNVAALLYVAQLALERNAIEKGLEHARRILDVDRGSAMGHLMVARALQQQNKLNEAKEEYQATLRSAPGMLIASVEVAGIQLKNGGNRNEALDALSRAHRVYPHILRTRLLLYSAGF